MELELTLKGVSPMKSKVGKDEDKSDEHEGTTVTSHL